MEKRITVLSGDGIGPEIVNEAVKVLDRTAAKFGHRFAYTPALLGGAAIDAAGVPLPDETLGACREADAVLLGAVGGPKWDMVDKSIRPETGLLALRAGMGLYANLRPSRMFRQLRESSPLRADIVEKGIDFVVVRELTGGIYFGKHETTERNGEKVATDVLSYSEHEIERIVRVAFDIAKKRRGKVTSVDKANVLDSSRLWREVAERTAKDYPDVSFSNMLVDNTAMQIVRDPSQFDVVVTENMFGDILTDEASMVAGSIGMIPSASLGDGKNGLYEPIHGSAPDIAGKNLANPIGTILAAAMMLRYSFDMEAEAKAIEDAVERALDEGYRTGDIAAAGGKRVSCSEMGDAVAAKI
ncbi:MAG TPA: 3-isopropylmalate dehydrogenase [Candidatus Fimivivens faecavium]|nr:3-isopropylmalate dehydrogenase [Candidatus Fimivivens faecavium]